MGSALKEEEPEPGSSNTDVGDGLGSALKEEEPELGSSNTDVGNGLDLVGSTLKEEEVGVGVTSFRLILEVAPIETVMNSY